MQLLKLTVLTSFLFALAFSFTSCEKEAEKKKNGNLFSKTDIPMTAAQVVPMYPTPSSALGNLAVTYNKNSKVLSYTFSWTGLADTIRGAEIVGPAPSGYASAAVKQALTGFTTNLKTNQATYPFQAGSYTGSLFVDEVVIKETDLLNHLYYLSLRTKAYGAAAGAPGEIRAQIRFQ